MQKHHNDTQLATLIEQQRRGNILQQIDCDFARDSQDFQIIAIFERKDVENTFDGLYVHRSENAVMHVPINHEMFEPVICMVRNVRTEVDFFTIRFGYRRVDRNQVKTIIPTWVK